MKTPLITKLDVPAIISVASHLKQKGQLARSKNNLVYLDIDDLGIEHDFSIKAFAMPKLAKKIIMCF